MPDDLSVCRNCWDDITSALLRHNGVLTIRSTHVDRYACAWHCHIGIEILHCLQGEGIFFLGDQRIPYTPGDLIVFDAKMPHRVQVEGTYLRRILCLWPTYFNSRSLPNVDVSEIPNMRPDPGGAYSARLSKSCSDRLIRLLDDIEEEATEKRPGYHAVIRLRLAELAVLIDRARKDTALPLSADTAGTACNQMAKIIVRIEKHLSQQLSVSAIARDFHYSPSQLYRLFIDHTGQSPSRYIRERRIAEAKRLLRDSDLPIAQIAAAVGLRNVANFSKTFRNETGASPTQYRRGTNTRWHKDQGTININSRWPANQRR